MFPHEEFARKVGLRTRARKVRRRAYADLPGVRQGVPEHLVRKPRLQALPCQCDLETGLAPTASLVRGNSVHISHAGQLPPALMLAVVLKM